MAQTQPSLLVRYFRGWHLPRRTGSRFGPVQKKSPATRVGLSRLRGDLPPDVRAHQQ